MVLNDVIIIPNIGAIGPSQYHPKYVAHYDCPKGSHLILRAYTESLH